MSETKSKVLICPYCGETQPANERCRGCGGLFEPLSRQASHNAMGPWYVRDERRPFQPGASYETVVKLVERGIITRYSILRGPTTKQFWTVARRIPGIAHLLGYCHNCDAAVSNEDHGCSSCGVPFGAYLDRNYLGLPEIRPLPWEAPGIEDVGGGGVSASLRGFALTANKPLDFRGAAEPLGISSFASDEELRGEAFPNHPASTSPHANGEHDEGYRLQSPSASISDTGVELRAQSPVTKPIADRAHAIDSAGAVAARSLQRRLDQQRSQIRLLMIVLALISVLSTVIILALLLRSAGVGSLGGTDSAETPSNAASTAQRGHQASEAGSAVQEHPVSSTSFTENQIDTAASQPFEQSDAPAGTSSTVDSASEYESAVALVEAANQEERPLKDRIRDVEKAIEIFEGVRDRTPADTSPQGLAKSLADAQRLLERLRLQEYFP